MLNDTQYKQITDFLKDYKNQFKTADEFLRNYNLYQVEDDLIKMFYIAPQHPKAVLFMGDNLNTALKIALYYQDDIDIMDLTDVVLADLLKKDEFKKTCSEIVNTICLELKLQRLRRKENG
jgi:Sec7-like guanine-nucleotide exchange factor